MSGIGPVVQMLGIEPFVKIDIKSNGIKSWWESEHCWRIGAENGKVCSWKGSFDGSCNTLLRHASWT